MNKPFIDKITDVHPLDAAWAAYNQLNRNSTDTEDVAAVADAAAAISTARNLVLCRELYLQGLNDWQQNEDQRIGLGLPQLDQKSLLDYCKQLGVNWSQELAEESSALGAANYRPREAGA